LAAAPYKTIQAAHYSNPSSSGRHALPQWSNLPPPSPAA
jgi:hypothetical protein